MGIEDLYLDYGIETAPEGHKHHRNGWINISCPHCSGSDGFHLGFNLEGAYYYCYRCGSHSVEDTLMKLLGVQFREVKDLISQYKIKRKQVHPQNTSSLIRIHRKQFRYPTGTIPLMSPHIQYLEKRNFDPKDIAKQWGALGTSPWSTLDKIAYKFRILIPIFWNRKIVSFQCRDYTEKQEKKYMACPESRELIHHKDILYGPVDLSERKRIILVEGVFDAWRLAPHAAATFGTGVTQEQTKVIANMFEEVVIIFDPEPVAQKRANQLKEELMFWNVKASVVGDLPTDPGDLSEDQAIHLLQKLNFEDN